MKILMLLLLAFPFGLIATPETQKEEATTDTAVLVRLRMPIGALETLRQQGREVQANEMQQKYYDEALEVVNAFNGNFTSYPIYFFWDFNSEKVIKGNLDGIFLDQNLNAVPEVSLNQKHFYVAEFNLSEKAGFEALFIRDKNLELMSKPFPYMVRTLSHTPFKREKSRVVEIMDERLKNHLGLN